MAAARLVAVTSASAERERLAWAALQDVPDPEVPVISVCELGIVREVHALPEGQGMEIVLTPTYSGCPATEVIERSVLDAIEAAGLGPARAVLRRAPAWTTDWISDDGRRKLREYGIAPPGRCGDSGLPEGTSPIRLVRRRQGIAVPEPVACPHCGSAHTERLSAFGATACKALHRCLDCREPFEHFKPI
ncbi:1,2-phenylacetyl-CoA epoxidase subunit PaaD [Delftia acidovorans]|uniref:1,2-phenylacetyl-CoA epoxidase subunit PaaD n=1 Tax=Delftia acidovorans TaxID=80866 RepID=UPI000BD4BFD4|nr:1,2-phenylacetyl-CoA epoxidase subunit PaaD [Delftia acidovorans]MPT02602.1 phenylacetate-CoA oxygenase subunit PaaJ [Delftia sp.]WAT85425.1 phenylacetate-CoA oxygenase subunit PaaJ [Delftia acidovorans]SOE38830.1 ring-1,2-phenylacetyl-CoA epoxidase subunit PaaD [Delftia acidovorans]